MWRAPGKARRSAAETIQQPVGIEPYTSGVVINARTGRVEQLQPIDIIDDETRCRQARQCCLMDGAGLCCDSRPFKPRPTQGRWRAGKA